MEELNECLITILPHSLYRTHSIFVSGRVTLYIYTHHKEFRVRQKIKYNEGWSLETYETKTENTQLKRKSKLYI